MPTLFFSYSSSNFLGTTGDFRLYPGYFVYYVRRLWLLLESRILAGSHSAVLSMQGQAYFLVCDPVTVNFQSLCNATLIFVLYLLLLELPMSLMVPLSGRKFSPGSDTWCL